MVRGGEAVKVFWRLVKVFSKHAVSQPENNFFFESTVGLDFRKKTLVTISDFFERNQKKTKHNGAFKRFFQSVKLTYDFFLTSLKKVWYRNQSFFFTKVQSYWQYMF